MLYYFEVPPKNVGAALIELRSGGGHALHISWPSSRKNKKKETLASVLARMAGASLMGPSSVCLEYAGGGIGLKWDSSRLQRRKLTTKIGDYGVGHR